VKSDSKIRETIFGTTCVKNLFTKPVIFKEVEYPFPIETENLI
jgi:hypothetical protein